MAQTQQSVPKTRITKMEMKGFKSFANRVDVPFGEEFNCILGPNGSGKSNVLDSLCFVLGKSGAKSLRAEKTANLIYNGGKSKKAAKQGEVHIYFENTSKIFPIASEEIKISRIVKPTGQSVYKINDETVTRTQITDLLSIARINPDGYNIILQGDIVRLVEMSPNERRTIMDEISGISIYEDKKNKAVRELERVDQQIKEADIVLAERGTYLKELKKERDQALKFKELDEKIKRNKATVVHRKIETREKKESDLQEKIDADEKQAAIIQKEIDSLKKQILKKKEEIDNVSREIEQKGEKEQVALMKEVEQIKVDLAVKKQRVEQLKQEQSRIAARRKELESSMKGSDETVTRLEKEIATSDKKIASREKDKERIEKKAEALRKKHDIANASKIDARMVEIDKEAEKIQEEVQKLRENQQHLFREKDRVEFQLQTIDEKIAKVLEVNKGSSKEVQQLKSDKKRLTVLNDKLNKTIDRASAIVPELQTAKGKLETRLDEQSKLRARQTSLREHSAAGMAVQKILDRRKTNPKIHGTVAELGNVQKKFSLALEIAAGGKLRSIIVDDDKTAAECIKYLKTNKFGVASFLPLNKVKSRPIPSDVRSLSGPGIHGLAIDLVRFDKKLAPAFQHALGATVIVENIATARKIGIGRVRMVTLDGDVIEPSGAMTGGHRARKKGQGAGFREEEVSGRLDNLEAEIADAQAVVSRLSSEQKALQEDIDTLRKERHVIEDGIAVLERELHIDAGDLDASKSDKSRLKAEAKELEEKTDAVIAQISDQNRTLAKLKMEKAKLREKISALRSPQVLAELNTFEQQKTKLQEEIVKLRTEAQGLKRQIQTIYGPEQENIQKILKQQVQEEKSFKKEQDALEKELTQMKKDLAKKEEVEKKFRLQFKGLFSKRTKLTEEKDVLDRNTIRAEERIRKQEHALSAASIQMAGIKAELAGLHEEFKEFKGIEPFKTKKDEDIAREIKQFERMVQDMGAVNMKALEMYEHVEREYTGLVTKKDTLASEREDVLLMINEIDAKKRDLFMKTFEAVEKHFKHIFSQLSSKGEAFLELETPDDPFAGGMTIRVRLSGNKFMDIRSLSGGEKTMTALAFLFAIQEYQPASFYILDEVDAALDKKNSERLGKLIRQYSNRAQYIIISHNDTIISEADTLYGVSMNEHGESQVTSLKI